MAKQKGLYASQYASPAGAPATSNPNAPVQWTQYKTKGSADTQLSNMTGQQYANTVNSYNQYMPDIMQSIYDSISGGQDLYNTGVTNQLANTNNSQNIAAMGLSRSLKGAGIQPGSTGHMQALNNLFSKYAVANSANLASLQQQEYQRKLQAQQTLAGLVSPGGGSYGNVSNAVSNMPESSFWGDIGNILGTVGANWLTGVVSPTKK